jgi:hypothetical protein
MVRKVYFCLLVGFILLITSTTSFAQQESWYWGFGLGPGLSTYSGDLGTSVSNLSSKSSIGLAGDLAFYFPVADGKTVIGPSLFFVNNFINSSISIYQGAVAFSILHSFGSEPGDGFFLRADLGFGELSASSTVYASGTTVSLGSALATAVTVGYGLPVSQQTRLLFQLRGEYLIGSSGAGAIAFTFGPLF